MEKNVQKRSYNSYLIVTLISDHSLLSQFGGYLTYLIETFYFLICFILDQEIISFGFFVSNKNQKICFRN